MRACRTWDARLDQHPAGKSSMRDFKDTHKWHEKHGRRTAIAPKPSPSVPPKKRPSKARHIHHACRLLTRLVTLELSMKSYAC